MKRTGMIASLLALVMMAGCAARNVFEASANGNYNQVKEMLDKDANLAKEKQPPSNRTALHFAIENNHPKIAQLLLDRGADPLAEARGGWTPLHEARQLGSKEIEDMLVKSIKESGRPLP